MPLRRTKDLSGYTIGAIDTDIGSVQDFYFDDQHWTIRYIVVATGIIFSGRKVLISLRVSRGALICFMPFLLCQENRSYGSRKDIQT
jgi:hypothetical protein